MAPRIGPRSTDMIQFQGILLHFSLAFLNVVIYPLRNRNIFDRGYGISNYICDAIDKISGSSNINKRPFQHGATIGEVTR